MNPIESHLLLILGKGLALSAIFFLLAITLLRGKSAHAVSLYWRTTLAGLIIVPLVSMYLPWLNLAQPEQLSETHQTTTLALPLADSDLLLATPLAEEFVVAHEPNPFSQIAIPEATTAHSAESRSSLLLGIWALGAALVLVRWVFSWRRVRKLLRSGGNLGSSTWEQELTHFNGNKRRVRVVISHDVKCPMVFGLWRPILLLPRDSDSWDAEKRRQVLTHEWCHIQRRDPAFLLLARLAVALHWVNPLAWLAAKRLRLAEERTADDAVLADGRDPAEYATLLAGFARRGLASQKTLPIVSPSMASPSTVRSRVQRILDAKQHRGAPRRITRWALGAIVSGAVLVAGGVSFSPVAAQEPNEPPVESEPTQPTPNPVANEMYAFKARNIIIPTLDFQDATLQEAVDFLRQRSRELDTWEPDPAKKGLNFVIIGKDVAKRYIPNLQLKNTPLTTVIEFICKQTGTSHEVGKFAITIKETAQATENPAKNPASAAEPELTGKDNLMAKLKRTIIPSLEFQEASLVDVVKFLRHQSLALDDKKGVNFVIRTTPEGIGDRKISMTLRKVPLQTALEYICDATNTQFKVDDLAVQIVDANAANTGFVTRTWSVPPTFVDRLARQADGDGDDPFRDDPKPKVRSLLELLEQHGIKFQKGAKASFLPEQSKLIVRASPANLDLVDAIVRQAIQDLPSMIKIRLELYEVPKAEALKIVKNNADKNEGSEAYRMVEALVAEQKAKLLSSPTTMARPGQRGKSRSGSELTYVAAYEEKDGKDVPIVKKVLVGSNFDVEPNMGADNAILDIRYALTMTRGEPKTVTRKIKTPVAGREVEVETIYLDTLTLTQGITTMSGQTQLLGMMQSSMKVDEPNEIMAFLTATVTKVTR